MSNPDPNELRKETGQVLGEAVAEVARVVLDKEIGPFKQSLAKARQHLESKVEDICDVQDRGDEGIARLEQAAIRLSGDLQQQRNALNDEASKLNTLAEELKTASQVLGQQGHGLAQAVEDSSKNVEDVADWLKAWRDEQVPDLEKRLSDQVRSLSNVSAKQEELTGMLSEQACLFSELRIKLDARLEEFNAHMSQQRKSLESSLEAKALQLRKLVEQDRQARESAHEDHRQLAQTMRLDADSWRSKIKVVLIAGIVAAVLSLGAVGVALVTVIK